MTKADLNWLAGFWEGEGWVSFSDHSLSYYKDKIYRRTAQFQVGLAQNDRTPLDWVKTHFGGGVYKNSGNCFHWRGNGPIGRKFLQTLLPYLRLTFRIDKVKWAIHSYEKHLNRHKGDKPS
jgi:hypothetical protein